MAASSSPIALHYGNAVGRPRVASTSFGAPADRGHRGGADCFSRKVVGWSMRSDMQAELVLDALQMAIDGRRPHGGLIHHSDQGSQYVALIFGQKLRKHIGSSARGPAAWGNVAAHGQPPLLVPSLVIPFGYPIGWPGRALRRGAAINEAPIGH